MTKQLSLVALAVITLTVCAAAFAAKSSGGDKAAIAVLEQRIANAVEAKNAQAILENYIPGDELLVFDAIPPRQYQGWDAYLKDWQGVLDQCAGKPSMKIGDLGIEVEGNLAYSHSIQHFACAGTNGRPLRLTMRTTDIYRKNQGKWLIVHEHNSVPVDLATAKADLGSKP
ncbi:MAG TPA: nuclear transport factor 2 family protein [Candidatus Binataceae bacterium]|nr:nuclear transport factor 2 family protein [Candidatus Binataceae bacterium]